ncbi:MAG TPA: bifunctional diaminohydroxyphosphoribosylaminopyrimidine deaminase/5-amino-6-(5-phosphoribosylamino)uracil reductase RibD [Candidatus Omnitrophota bacterium]|nr:bifunctional diaminohydroxyphosphoribosylaminopyrimidine deaminase/5-amino-6-(5-phosphoribosylamino)uracil reductase RibD [Candidatus Omnitrophota bacterium]
MSRPQDEKWMRWALALAAKGRFTVSPNPMVGACVVLNGKLVGSGYHEKFGGSHAEPHALLKAGEKSKGATLYVTLEPCATWQKTPPCAPLIKEKGIKEVVIGLLDPNPLNHGKGVRYLREQGIAVRCGILGDEVKKQNEGFLKYISEKRPFVTLKMAQTLDGKIATREGLSRWISSPPSREFVHRLRAEHDAVLVGKNTFYQDDPRLTVPKDSPALIAGKPWKVVMISGKGCPSKARVLRDDRLTILVFSEKHLKEICRNMNDRKGSVMFLPVKEKKGQLNVRELLEKLASMGITKLLVEGGGELAWSFLEGGCVDRVIWIVAPKIFGGRFAKTSVEGLGVRSPQKAFHFHAKNFLQSGGDWIFEGYLKKK